MKNHFRCAVAALALTANLLPVLSRAQALPTIPTPGFETWTSRTIAGVGGPVTYQAPVGWDVGFFSAFSVAFGLPLKFSRSTVAHSGSASLTLNIGADSVGGDVLTSFPVNRAPAGMTLWARNSRVLADTADTGVTIVIFTRSRPGGVTDTVAVGGTPLFLPVANAWRQLTFPIVPLMSATPDTALILSGVFGGVGNFQVWLDDLAFVNTVPTGTPADVRAAPLSLSPNPVSATGPASTLTVAARMPGRAVLTVTDVTGRAAGRVRVHTLASGENRLPIPTAGLAAGTYVVTLLSGEGTRSARIVVE